MRHHLFIELELVVDSDLDPEEVQMDTECEITRCLERKRIDCGIIDWAVVNRITQKKGEV